MKDIYRELARRSIKDAAYLSAEVAEDEGIAVPDKMTAQFAMSLYQHRVQEHRHKQMQAEAENMDPQNSGGMIQ